MDFLGLNAFDGILYINLAIRKDRKIEMERELKRVFVKKHFRIEGKYDELNGARGCVECHIKALEFAMKKGWKNVLILEDDCDFVKPQNEIDAYIHHFLVHFQKDWDVFFLGTKIEFARRTSHPAFVQILFSMRSHAYVVNQPYFEKLRNHYVSTLDSMKNDLFFLSSMTKALDRRWVELQMVDRWFAGIQPIADQRTSFSDIEKTLKPQR
jgi:GR25 family glycosyltransferase involved in LPS biosynthesis